MSKLITKDIKEVVSKEDLVATLLEYCDIKEPPSPSALILEKLNLRQLTFDFLKDVPGTPKDDQTDPAIRAVLSLKDRIVAVHSGLHEKRKIFSIFHEIGHFLIPRHQNLVYNDTLETLSYFARLKVEKEANQVAADIIFQLDRFSEMASDYDLGVKAVRELAPIFNVSFEASARRYVEKHYLPCALIVYQESPDEIEDINSKDEDDLPLVVQYTIISPSFSDFKKVTTGQPEKKDSVVDKVFRSVDFSETVEDEFTVVNKATGEETLFNGECFTNGYKVFALLSPKNP